MLAFCGLHTDQPFGTSSEGSGLDIGLTGSTRSMELVAPATASFPLSHAPKPNSILDWPEHIQTSPTITSWKVIVFLPVTTSSKGPPAGNGFRRTFHVPSASATVVAVCPAIVTVTLSPGAAQPQIASARSRCS